MNSTFVSLLTPLSRRRGVVGCVVADAHDGIVVEAVVRQGVNANTVAALAASLYGGAVESARAAEMGEVGFLRLEAERGHVFAIGSGELVLVVIADVSVNVGQLRVDMLKARENLT